MDLTQAIAGRYYSDEHGRTFEAKSQPGGGMLAGYAFGDRRLPQTCTPAPNGRIDLAQVQALMWAVVARDIDWLSRRAEYLARMLGATSHTSEIYDAALTSVMSSAVLFSGPLDDQSRFRAYASVAIRNAVYTRIKAIWATEQRLVAIAEDQLAEDVDLDGNPVAQVERLEDLDIAELWQWAVERKTMQELGDLAGVRKTTISSRIGKIRNRCRALLQ